MDIKQLLFILFLFSACTSSTSKKNVPAKVSMINHDSSLSSNYIQHETKLGRDPQNHLEDTTRIKGDYVLFLLPDSTRFEDYASEDEHIYDADSDFGMAI